MKTNFVNTLYYTFLTHQPQRIAVMQPLGSSAKYLDRNEIPTLEDLRAHISGNKTIAIPYAQDGLAQVLPFDIDAGGLPAIRAVMAELADRGLWSFAIYTPFADRADHEQHGYVYVPFAELINAERLQFLGTTIANKLTEFTIDPRATRADTRLPFGRHTWNKRYGILLIDQLEISIDNDLITAVETFIDRLQHNSIERLPELPTPAPKLAPAPRPTNTRANAKQIISEFNAAHYITNLLEEYGATWAGTKLMSCPFHDDKNPSLTIWEHNGLEFCKCLSRNSQCPAAERALDPFGVYCLGEGLTTVEALKKLNPIQPKNNSGSGGGENKKAQAQPKKLDQAQPKKKAQAQPKKLDQAQREQLAYQTTQTAINAGLRGAALSVLSTVINHMNQQGEAFYSVAQYAAAAGVSERTVQRWLTRFVELGIFHQRQRFGETTVYRYAALVPTEQPEIQQPEPQIPLVGGDSFDTHIYINKTCINTKHDHEHVGGGDSPTRAEPATVAELAEPVAVAGGAEYNPAHDWTSSYFVAAWPEVMQPAPEYIEIDPLPEAPEVERLEFLPPVRGSKERAEYDRLMGIAQAMAKKGDETKARQAKGIRRKAEQLKTWRPRNEGDRIGSTRRETAPPYMLKTAPIQARLWFNDLAPNEETKTAKNREYRYI
jgi:hypothetical protein